MDNVNILEIIDLYAREHNLLKDELLPILEDTLKSTWEQEYGNGYNLEVKISKNEIIIQRILTIVEKVTDPKTEIEGTESGSKIESHNLFSFSEKSIQFFKRNFMDNVEAFNRKKQYDLFQDKQGEIISGIVAHKDDKIHVRIFGIHKAIIPREFSVKTEIFKPKDKILALVREVRLSESGHQIILDRKSNEFIAQLMAFYIPEIARGIVKIRHIVRRPGAISKVVVDSSAENDCIGACLGVKGQKIKPVINELQKERVDLIRWSDNHKEFIRNCLKGIEIKHIEFGELTIIVVKDDQMGKAIHMNASAANISKYEGKQVTKLIDSIIGSPVRFVSETEYSNQSSHSTDQIVKLIASQYGQEEEIREIFKTYGEIWNIPAEIQRDYQGIYNHLQQEKYKREKTFLERGGSSFIFDLVSNFNNAKFDMILKNAIFTENDIKKFEGSNQMSSQTGLDVNTCVFLINSV